MHNLILSALSQSGYQPLKPKALFRKLEIDEDQYAEFKKAVKELAHEGRLHIAGNQTIRPAETKETITGTFRKAAGGFGFVRQAGGDKLKDVHISEEYVGDAITGDVVLVRLRKKARRPGLGPSGQILKVLERATQQFVGTYFERDGQGFVRIDGTVFSHSIFVGDPGAKGAKPNDKVVLEMLRFPGPEDRGEGVITEILGPRGQPGVDTLSIIRALGLPDVFPEEVLQEARDAAARFNEQDLADREDLTGWMTVTIDPVDARDFDDAISLTQDPKSKHWSLGVHIADVGHFAPPGSALDREARKRGTSVYLPQRVLPMFPELISNSMASLQEGRVRLVKSVIMDLSPQGQTTHVRFANAAIRNNRRFSYEQVMEILSQEREQSAEFAMDKFQVEPAIVEMLWRMRDVGMILRKRRLKRGSLELSMPEAELEFDDQGRITGAHFRKHDISHQLIEEFMLLANESVAGYLDRAGIHFLRRAHPAPEPSKLKAFAEFARILGYKVTKETDRFTLQRILAQSANRPEAHAVHYALLRSLKQATYHPDKEDHYALASENYCHFTSPIRRYPDLSVHRLLDQILRRGRAGSDRAELLILGAHCSKTERRAELAERELVKFKLLTYMSQRLGMEMAAIITGVADYGFYAQCADVPVEGLVHITTLPDDFYHFDEASHSFVGQRHKRRYRLGDKVNVTAVRVDLQKRQLDFRVTEKKKRVLSGE